MANYWIMYKKNLEFFVYLPFQNFDFDYEHIKTIAAIKQLSSLRIP